MFKLQTVKEKPASQSTFLRMMSM